ncbi:hypothetical protein BY458DRAFT_429281 [Sporodiniella umbellata]|nr:hypothetical protein BY458DRAFT_429281 [Sporodiniella umbellata]
MDSSHVLSDRELENELDIFANVQFTYDMTPGSALGSKQDYRRASVQQSMHSLLNVKLASLVDRSGPTAMSSDAIARFYDNTPDCTPPNGYYSPNVSPPNGFDSPNPTPPNGVLPEQAHGVFQTVVINPPLSLDDDVSYKTYDDEEFMTTMRALTSLDEKAKGNKKPAPLSKEDKRKRNTAASARFRVKKKMREQALQLTATEMTEKAKVYELRVQELEMEVKWLRALLVEKKERTPLPSKSESH